MTIRLETGRLVLAPLAEADAEALARIGDDPEIARWMAALPSPFTLDLARARIAASRPQGRFGFRLGIWETAGGALIGEVGLGPADASGAPDASWWLARAAQGRGHGREAAAALAGLAFGMGARALRAEIMKDNAPSRRILAGLGFAAVGSGGRCGAKTADVVKFALSRERWAQGGTA